MTHRNNCGAHTIAILTARQYLRRIQTMGMWPKDLPLQNFSTGDDFERTLKIS